MLWPNGYEKQLKTHITIKTWVQNHWEIDMMFHKEWVKTFSQRGNMSIIQKNSCT